MLSVSATIPWPAKAASPWTSNGKTFLRCSISPRMRCRARAFPSTTGSTASRWLGLAARRISTCAPEVKLSNRSIAEMILHIAVSRDELRDVVGAEFGENYLERFFEEIRQHIEPAAVRHSHANLLDATLLDIPAESCRGRP